MEYYAINIDPYFQHHGVKGQKWGVRNGPPYPIEDKVLKAGTRIKSVTGDYSQLTSEGYRNSGKWMYTYRADEEWDNKVYKGPFAYYLAVSRGKEYLREHEFEVVKDLRMPTKKERVTEFKDLYNDKKYKSTVISDMERVRKMLISQKVGNESEQAAYKNIDLNNLNDESDFKTAYSIFNHAMEFNYAYGSTREYSNRMAKKYDAMVDDNNQGDYNDARDPIIIFKAHEVLKTIGDTSIEDIKKSMLTPEEVIKNYNDVDAELSKAGKKVKL